VSDATRDGARYWSQLAKDWARASAYGFELLQEVAEEGVGVAPAPPDPDRPTRRTGAPATSQGRGTIRSMVPDDAGEPETAPFLDEIAPGPGAMVPSPGDSERTTIPVPDLGDATPSVTADLVSIEAGSAVIPASAVTATVISLDDGTPAVHVSVATSGTRAGLYVGRLDISGREGIPIQLYVSHALRTTPQ
jgi:hypothetical protein